MTILKGIGNNDMCQVGDIILINRFKDARGTEVSRHPFIVVDDAAGMIGGLDFDLVSVMTTSYKGDTDSYNKRFDPGYVHLDASDGMKKESHAFVYDLYYFNLQKIDYQIIGQLETEAFNRVLDVIDEFDREGLLRVIKTNL